MVTLRDVDSATLWKMHDASKSAAERVAIREELYWRERIA